MYSTIRRPGRARSLPQVAMIGFLMAIGGVAKAGAITAQGSVTALTNISQMDAGFVTAGFETTSPVPLNAYSTLGMDIAPDGASFSSLLPGIVSSGTASGVPTANDANFNCPTFFPATIAGGGSCDGNIAFIGMVATFSIPITQFGATLSRNGSQFITAWGASGDLIGQVTWSPSDDASFVGLDSGSTPIAMIALGNDDVFGGATYQVGGSTTIWDNAVWNGAIPEPGTLALLGLGLGLAGLAAARRRKLI